ncbi:MAG: 50S ribosomal protein L2, partial [Candidatus Omnitrophica bacterium]|nr:50S ribosomal protein L2 [Candidatus Omnitrophota bacterium]MBU1851824.1 50S ribosomal protein L2 [Candidatus Omnitrophota bacterium]
MGIRKLKATSPASRWATCLTFEEITVKKPEKSLTTSLRKTGGRNNRGRKTVSSKGGGHKRSYRMIDFRYSQKGQTGVVEAIEYDPNRSSNIALVKYEDGRKAYIIAPVGIKAGLTIECGPVVKMETGNATELKNIPLGTMVHCVEMDSGRGAKIARSAGSGVTVAAKDGGDVHLRMPSGEIRL